MDLHLHDLRKYTFDRHRTVDDTPYGGGAGMVMKAEPWGLALDEVLAASPLNAATEGDAEGTEPAADTPADTRPLLIVPSPAGAVFDQAMAYELAEEKHIVFAPARYEGIDERVLDWAQESFRVMPVSLGDYVLYGGEVAVMAMIEAITRLIPGAMGNPASLEEERIRAVCWSIRCTRSPRCGVSVRCRRCCCRVITVRLRVGVVTVRLSAPLSAARTCWRPTRWSSGIRRTAVSG